MRKILNILSAPFRWTFTSYQHMVNFLTEEPEDTPLPDVVANSVNDLEGVLYHVNELRKHLLRSVLFMIVTVSLSFIFTPKLIDYLAGPIGGIAKLQAIDPTEPISVFMRVALLAGFVLALPYIAFELWLFAAPGLKRHTRIYGLVAIPAVAIFFIGGMAFAYYAMLPAALDFLLHFMGISTIPRPSTYISFVTGLMFWVGVIFEFPFVIFILASMGFIHGRTLLKQWRIAIVIIAILAAVITPTVDPISMGLLMAPMILLYFFSIGLAFLTGRKSVRAATENSV